MYLLKELRHPEKFNLVIRNPCQSSPSITIFDSLWFIVISLVFFRLSKLLFSGFPSMLDVLASQNNSNCRD